MRMRKKKHGAERLSACAGLLLNIPEEPMADPAAALDMPGAEVYLEIGSGKGGFAIEMARRNPSWAYIAMERVADCVMLAAESARDKDGGAPKNLRFLPASADELTSLFENRTVSGIFLNFSDPWTKKGYAKRRLTHSRYLKVYFNLLKDGGVLRFKTDNSLLFDFTLEELSSLGLTPRIVTRDLHASEYDGGNVRTEYELAFSEAGFKINMLEVVKPDGFAPEIPDDLRRGRKIYYKIKDEDNEARQ